MFATPSQFVAVIKIIGVGGGGNNAVNRMIEAGLTNVEYIGCNTDTQALRGCMADELIALGPELTQGLGAGNTPSVGEAAAEESRELIRDAVKGADLIFVTAGEGGGTGTGAAPIIARLAKETGALTIGVVTRPFDFEGRKRANHAEEGIQRLSEHVDTLVVVPNEKLLAVSDNIAMVDAFRLADDVLRQGVQAITEIITNKGLINVDFADVRHVLDDSGSALIGIGHASGKNRARDAAIRAIDSPLLESSIDGATRVLFNISGSDDLALFEVNEASEIVASAVDPEANMVFGTSVDPSLDSHLKVTVVASGFRERSPRTAPSTPVPERRQQPVRQQYHEPESVDIPTFLKNR